MHGRGATPRKTHKQETRASLETYRQKRHFEVTPEPPPKPRRARGGRTATEKGQLEFVVQRHDARRLHYDVRLEVNGAMMSFAVPKGPSYDPTVKRLAVETEDHPMAYNQFQGRIPDGEYGAGEVLIWDRGTYETVPPGQEEAMRAKGHIVARFHGEKLDGTWHFVRTRMDGAKAQWLMWKAKDGKEDASVDIVATRPESVAKANVPLTNPTKVLYPRDKITKADVAAYYAAVADVMLPHLAGRPIGVQRWPNGIDGEAWFQQNAPPKVPDYVRVIDPGGEHEAKRKIIIENRDTFAYLANLAALTIHQWASHVPPRATGRDSETALEHADYTVIDLDPGDGPWEHVVRVAEAVRDLLERLHLVSVVKTSGQRGLHVLVPFGGGPTHTEATAFGREVAAAVADALPDIATVERMKAKRGGRLYVDALQNGSGKTIVAPYSLRAKDGAPVSTPIAWSEVTKKLDPRTLTLRTVPERIAKKGDLLEPLLSVHQGMPAVSRDGKRHGA
jgi:bifunctional non-homologous end joining protein LigD